MEPGVGPPSQSELVTVNAGSSLANAAHNIKQEMGEMTDNKLTVTDSGVCLPIPSSRYGDDWSLFASYTSSVSSENGIGEQPTSGHVQLPALNANQKSSCTQSCSEQIPGSSVPVTVAQSLMPVTNSQLISVPCRSSQSSVPVTSSRTFVSLSSSQPLNTVTSSPMSVPGVASRHSKSSPTSVYLMNSQSLVSSQPPHVPNTASHMLAPITIVQSSALTGSPPTPAASSQPSVSLADSQPSSSTWYRQPLTVPSHHSQRESSAPKVGACEQSPPSCSQTERKDAKLSSSSQENGVMPAVQRTDADVATVSSKRGGQQGNVLKCGSACPDVLEEKKLSPVITQAVKQSRRLTRQSTRGGTEKVERTTRRLRAQQKNPQSQTDREKRTRSTLAPGSQKSVAHCGPSPVPLSQDPPPPPAPPTAQERKPQRTKRKSGHSQRTWRPDVRGEPLDRWRVIGQSQGLTSDTDIAIFLMQYYDKNNATSKQSSKLCANCHAILTLTCLACQPSLRAVADTNSDSLKPSDPSAKAGNAVIMKAKAEPVDPLQDDQQQQQIQATSEMQPEPEPEEDAGVLLEYDEDFKEETEEKPQLRHRRRGRPVGSRKKSPAAEKIPSPQIKLSKARKYKCTHEGCESSFTKSSRLKIHTRIHTGEKPFLCKDCGKAFSQKSGLTVHSQKHTGLRPFTCGECGATFPSSSTLKQHMRRHTGEKPFACKKCDKTFRWSGHLTQHMRMHDGIKPFLCPDCGKSFSASSDLVKHRVTHTKSRPYKCDKCDKAYAFQHRLTAHQRSHTGDRPFLCSECGAAFSRAHNLTVHMRTHTGDKPYWCKDCGAKFSDSGNFCKHKKTKHGDNAQNPHATKPNGTIAGSRPLTSAAPSAEMTVQLDITKLTGYESLLEIKKAEEEEGAEGVVDDISGKPSSIVKLMSRVGELSSADTVKLPSMAKVARRAKRERNRRESNMTLTSMTLSSMTLTPSSVTSHASLPSGLPADFKNLLPPLGGEQPLVMTALPRFSSSSACAGSPPTLPVQRQPTVSPTVSPVLSLPAESSSSPGPAASNQSTLSASSSADQISEYQTSQPDEVVFPPQYYSSYPYYCQPQP